LQISHFEPHTSRFDSFKNIPSCTIQLLAILHGVLIIFIHTGQGAKARKAGKIRKAQLNQSQHPCMSRRGRLLSKGSLATRLKLAEVGLLVDIGEPDDLL